MKLPAIVISFTVALAISHIAAGAAPTVPGKAFLEAPLYVTPGPGIAPGPSGFSVAQIIDGSGPGTKTWKALDKGRWVLGISRVDPMSGRQQQLSMMFGPMQAKAAKDGVVILRMTGNGQEFPPGMIFEFVRMAAMQAEAKN